MRRRVLVVSQRFWPENCKINDICRSLVRKGVSVTVLCGKPNYPGGKYYKGYSLFGKRSDKFDDITLIRLPEIRLGEGSPAGVFLNYVSFYISSRLFWRRANGTGYDAVLVFQTSPVFMDIAGFKIAKKQGIKLIEMAIEPWPAYAVEEQDIQNALLKKLVANISKRHYAQADKIIAVSEAAREYFIKELDIPTQRVGHISLSPEYVLYSGEAGDDLRDKYAGSFCVMCSGAVFTKKGAGALIGLAKKLSGDGIFDIRFAVMCDGSKDRALKSGAEKEGLGDYFFFERYSTPAQLSQVAHVADVILYLAKAGGASNLASPHCFTDLLAAGKPMLVSSAGLERNILKESGAGLGSDPEDTEALYRNLIRLYTSDSEELSGAGSRALRYLQEHYNRNEGIERLKDALEIGTANEEKS